MNALQMAGWLRESAAVIRAEQVRLGQLDAAIGDGDHGANMTRGFDAVTQALDDHAGELAPGRILTSAGRAFSARAGGASGPLWGVALRRAGRSLGARELVSQHELADALQAARAGIVELGAAALEDKTMLDALAPAVDALYDAARREVSELDGAVAAARAAEAGARATIPMLARKGRAAYLGERSIGHQDPGATSVALVMRSLSTALNGRP